MKFVSVLMLALVSVLMPFQASACPLLLGARSAVVRTKVYVAAPVETQVQTYTMVPVQTQVQTYSMTPVFGSGVSTAVTTVAVVKPRRAAKHAAKAAKHQVLSSYYSGN